MRVKQFTVEQMKGNSLFDSFFFYLTVFIFQKTSGKASWIIKTRLESGSGLLRSKKFRSLSDDVWMDLNPLAALFN